MERLAPAAETMGQQWQFNFQKAERSKKWKQKRNELTLCWRPSPAFLRFFPTWFRFCLPPAGLPPAGRGKITDADHGSPITAAMETIEKRNKKNKKRPAKAPITSNDKRNAHTISLLTRNTRRTHTYTHTHTHVSGPLGIISDIASRLICELDGKSRREWQIPNENLVQEAAISASDPSSEQI